MNTKPLKRVLSLLVTIVMLLSVFPLAALADEGASNSEQTNTEHLKDEVTGKEGEKENETPAAASAAALGQSSSFAEARAAKEALSAITSENDLELVETPGDGFFLGNASAGAVDIYVSTNSDSDNYFGIRRVADNLATDIGQVTGKAAAVKTGSESVSSTAVIVGMLGESPLIDGLAASGKLDVKEIEGLWESYVLQVVDNPMPGVTKGFIVAGSDRRGTIYGIYKISETIGVSPNGFFADSVPVRKTSLTLSADRVVKGEPSVKYRGIFLNDERSTQRWQNEYNNKVSQYKVTGPDAAVNLTGSKCISCPPEDNCTATGGNHSAEDWSPVNVDGELYAPSYRGFDYEGYYTYVFDFILRTGGNYLWPTMWNNAFWKDDPMNPIMADKYGVVMGASHQEFMGTSDKEWVWSDSGAWDWIGNREGMIDFWQEAMNERVNMENIFQFGLRGLNDSPAPGAGSTTHNVNTLEDVVNEQYEILRRALEYNNDPRPIEDIPKSLTVYNEVEAIYYSGVNLPTDITLMLINDNQQHVRTLPTDKMREERYADGGLGMYYHFDYNGSPRSYRWVNALPMEKVREQMTMAYDYGVDRIWIVNVGDLKFNEMPINYWMKLGTDIEKWGALDGPENFYRKFASLEFGEEMADEVADILFNYSQINDIRKPEWLAFNTFSLNYFNEAETILNRYLDLRERATYLFENVVPEYQKDNFYNIVMHPVNVSSNAWEVMVNLQRSKLYANATTAGGIAGPAATVANDYATVAMNGVTRDTEWMWYTYGAPGLGTPTTLEGGEDYYTVANGKWYGYYPRLSKQYPHTEVRDANSHDASQNIYYLNMGTGNNGSWQHGTWQFNITPDKLTSFSNEPNPPNSATQQLRGWIDSPAQAATMVVLPQSWDMGFYDGFVNNNVMNLPNARTGSIDLYPFDSNENETRYVEVANAGALAFDYTVTAPSWIMLDKKTGTIGGITDSNKLDRVHVSIDWSNIPASAIQDGVAEGSITVTGAGAAVTVNVTANVFDPALLDQLPLGTFVETNGYVSILSKNYTKSVAGSGYAEDAKWTVLPRYGREQSSVKVQPSLIYAQHTGVLEPGVDSPYVEYPVYIETPGDISIVTQWAATNPLHHEELGSLRYGITFGNDQPQIIDIVVENHAVRGTGWTIPVETAVRTLTATSSQSGICTSVHKVSEPGLYTLRVFMVNDGMVLEKILVGTEARDDIVSTGSGARARSVPNIFIGPAQGGPSGGNAANNPYRQVVTNPAARTSFLGAPQTYFKNSGTDGNMEVKDIPGPIATRPNLVTDNRAPAPLISDPVVLAGRSSASSGLAVNAFDNDSATVWTPSTTANEWVAFDFDQPYTFDSVSITEVGNNVKSFALQMWTGTAWSDIFTGTTIGPDYGEKIFPATGAVASTTFTRTTSRIRLLILKADAPPVISGIQLAPFTNHALGGTASAGATTSNQGSPAYAISGNRVNNSSSSRWQSNSVPNHLQVIWGEAKPISIVNMFVPRTATGVSYNRDIISTNGFSAVNYEYTDDGGTTWKPLGLLRTNGKAWLALNLQTPVTMNGVRAKFTQNDAHADNLIVVELEALQVHSLTEASTISNMDKLKTALTQAKLVSTTDWSEEDKQALKDAIATGQALVDASSTDDEAILAAIAALEAAASAQPIPRYGYVPYGTPELATGVIDPLWDDAKSLPVDRHLTMANGPASGLGKLLWDDQNLYVLAEITDPVLNNSNSNTYQHDSVEIFVDENNSKASSFGNGMGQYRVSFTNQQSFGNTSYSTGFESWAWTTDTGYVVLAKIPFKYYTPAANKEIGFDLQINDAGVSGSRQDVVMWYDTSGSSYNNGSGWGTARLMEKDTVPVDKTNLNAAIAKASGLTEGEYTAESWAVLANALTAAQGVAADTAATQEAVDSAAQTLTQAIEALVKAVEPVDKSALEALIDEAEGLKETDYTAESWAIFANAFAAAKSAAADATATQEDVNAAVIALQGAMDGLAEVDPGEEIPVTALKITGSSTVKRNKTAQLTAVITPTNATDKEVVWTSVNPNVAEVDENGLVTATSQTGFAIIQATASNGVTAQFTIRVTA
ncbi:glycosyl hydrolase 115 family protein [Oscillospiraceae bacterium MB08-C2-2]|nr:glycosyl hydrolase 115 family protein [Oscillospiraceae bacterium MB08-C2-2]